MYPFSRGIHLFFSSAYFYNFIVYNLRGSQCGGNSLKSKSRTRHGGQVATFVHWQHWPSVDPLLTLQIQSPAGSSLQNVGVGCQLHMKIAQLLPYYGRNVQRIRSRNRTSQAHKILPSIFSHFFVPVSSFYFNFVPCSLTFPLVPLPRSFYSN